ncbi:MULTISPECIES: 16S rRNA (uracil(1498)-N(3))-methyltransferase [unclassified Treponema]|uniref:RsmE family RNA methyltransferase n=1 Tax=unclassified Treponema TaxID=2638727 RepID=UPI0020A31728|nr:MULTISPECIES: 16S rRNA (uracil(1498)-N(3))-methyltransferase [unclassified Treponema]UTC67610.1 16S rRNA (uracil(1498)-N(3))-methyltransferase [Treponema sp. OMZ 789]UTC70338.1 16S rRNA (uracil(1498)-N(3))-methyltransferase [Treponema sp. OMZ 790]UTC73052.1 16S rRNA (uracil(1498)-N(3))-methyltransferase [Treponema sp. OMZ 791]
MKQLIVSAEPGRDIIRLDKKDYNYLVSVRRIKEGQVLTVSLNGIEPASAEVLKINTEKKYIELKILKEEAGLGSSLYKPRAEIILMQWLIKGNHMDIAVRQAAETGVFLIVPVLGEFSVIKKENINQTERRERIIREARQQSGSLVNTKILPAQELKTALDEVLDYTAKKETAFIMLSEKKANFLSLFDCLSEKTEAIVLAIGCEGGISPKEIEFLKEHKFEEVHFNTNVLRAETAAIYSIAAAQVVMEEKGGCKKN